jgi:hypothetical protein
LVEGGNGQRRSHSAPRGRHRSGAGLHLPGRCGRAGCALAFGLSIYSRYRTFWPGGGQVGLHGTNQPGLIPGLISNGCIRLRNRHVLRLDRKVLVGTPVLIR